MDSRKLLKRVMLKNSIMHPELVKKIEKENRKWKWEEELKAEAALAEIEEL